MTERKCFCDKPRIKAAYIIPSGMPFDEAIKHAIKLDLDKNDFGERAIIPKDDEGVLSSNREVNCEIKFDQEKHDKFLKMLDEAKRHNFIIPHSNE